jgi:hypothetical protein
MEVVHNDRRSLGELGRIVGDRRDDVGRDLPVHPQQVSGVAAET